MSKTIAPERDVRPAQALPYTGVTAGQLCLTFAPFGLGMAVAIGYAELSQDLRLFRALYAVRASLLLAIPALALFPFRDRSPGVHNVWRLFWTFSFLAYAVHLAYSWFGVFGGQIETARLHPDLFKVAKDPTILELTIAHQGTTVTYSNFAVSALWLLDVALAWVASGARGAGRGIVVGFHALTWLYVLISFGVATILFGKHDLIRYMGWSMVGVVVFALMLRAVSPRFTSEPSAAPATR